jgi:uncharacterized protein
MPSHARNHIVHIADLIDRPGVSRRVDLAIPADVELDMATLVGDVRLEGVLESVVEGILVRAELSAEIGAACSRCLADLQEGVTADVVELFIDPVGAEDPDDLEAGYEITDATINLDTLIRDALVPAVPYRPLCTQDCKGLCAQCGVNRNETECSCVDVTVDARWAALEGLQLRDDN